MNETFQASQPAATRWWARVPLGLLAIAGLTLLAADAPSRPATAWATINQNPRGEARETLLVAIWLLLVLACLTLWRSVFSPERQDTSLSESVVPPKSRRRAAPPAAVYVPRSRELLAIFATPRPSTASPIELEELPVTAPIEASTTTLPVRVALPRMLRLFGPLTIDATDQQALRSRPTRGLIAYLAVKRTPATLDELLEALWPDEPPTKLTRQRLWKAKRQAHALLGDALQRQNDRYQLDRSQLHSDIDEIERLLRGQPDQRRLEEALALMQAEPLADIDYAWAENERRRLQALHTETLSQAASARLQAGDASGTLNAAEQLIELDPLDEHGWRLGMEAEAVLGRRQAILDRYQQLTRHLDERLGLRPSAETRDSYHRLLSQDRQADRAE